MKKVIVNIKDLKEKVKFKYIQFFAEVTDKKACLETAEELIERQEKLIEALEETIDLTNTKLDKAIEILKVYDPNFKLSEV